MMSGICPKMRHIGLLCVFFSLSVLAEPQPGENTAEPIHQTFAQAVAQDDTGSTGNGVNGENAGNGESTEIHATEPFHHPVHHEAAPETETRLWNLQDVDILSLINEVSRLTGKNFIVDPRVSGRVTMVSGHPMDAEETYAVFLSLLQILGYAVVPGPDADKIVPEANAKQLGLPVVGSGMQGVGDEMVVRVVKVHNVAAAQLLSALRPLVPQQGHLAAYPPTNVLIIADRANNIERLVDVIQQVDQASDDAIEVVPVKHAIAAELVNLITTLETGQTRGQTESVAQLFIASDDRTNSVLLSGDPQRKLRARVLIAHLDKELPDEGNTEVVYLKYQRAENLAPILEGLALGYSVGGSSQALGSDRQSQPLSSTRGQNSGLSGGYRGNSMGSSTSSASNTAMAPTSGGASRAGGGGGARSNPFGQPMGNETGIAIQWEGDTNALIITAPQDVMRRLKTVIARLDVRRAQVLVEAMIVEIDLGMTYELGIDWSIDSGNVIANNAGGIVSEGSGFNIGFLKGNFDIIAQALSDNTGANILSMPNLLTLDNEEAEILVADNIPIPTGTQTAVDTENLYTTFERRDVGVILRVRPQINHNGTIRLDIEQEVSTVQEGSISNTDAGGAITSERRIATTVMVDDSAVLVLGGLISDSRQDAVNKTPILGDIPLIKYFFRSTQEIISKTNLLVFIRPVVLWNQDDSTYLSTGKYTNMRNWQTAYQRDGLEGMLERSTETPTLPDFSAPLALPYPFPGKQGYPSGEVLAFNVS